MADEILRGLCQHHDVRVVVALTGESSAEAARRHEASSVAAAAMARAGTAALLLATLTKGEERVMVQLRGGGPLGLCGADARARGEVRMMVQHARTAGAAGAVAAAVGAAGAAQVARDLGLEQSYVGQSPLSSGEIDEDIEHYLVSSEQIDSALGCAEVVDGDGGVQAAAGVLVQCLPGGVGGELVGAARARLRAGTLRRALAEGARTPAELLRQVIGDVDVDLLDRRPLRFHCGCTRERVADALRVLAVAELEAMIAEARAAEVVCDFCRERYQVQVDELRALAQETRSGR
jgi:molecular chaperone Hsp33